jgi:Chaperone of endosialidase
MKTKNMTASQLRNSISRSPLWRTFLLITLAIAIAWFALSPVVQAVTPAPDGGYPGNNTAEGEGALFSNTAGSYNTATGFDALFNNTGGEVNTATGARALFSNTTGIQNTATGDSALYRNTTGENNTATGEGALADNTTGSFNTATGYDALEGNATGHDNLANGVGALRSNTTGYQNTANGSGARSYFTGALTNNTTGYRNTATGNQALLRNNTGNGNTAEGFQALANNTGSFNTAVGFTAGANLTTGHDNVDIQALGVAGESNTMRIGTVKQTATYITGISGATVASGATVIVGSDGHLGTVTSSARFKESIKPMDKASEAILALKPVTFRYKKQLDPDGIPQFGLVAEQVEKVNPDLVARDEQGKVYTVRYEAVNAMLLNEFLKEHRKVQAEEGKVAQLETTVAKQQKEIEALTAGLQRVSDRLEASKPAPQLVADNQ